MTAEIEAHAAEAREEESDRAMECAFGYGDIESRLAIRDGDAPDLKPHQALCDE